MPGSARRNCSRNGSTRPASLAERWPRLFSLDETLERLKAVLADRYTLEKELGRGGMATVYLAKDLTCGRASKG